MSRIGFVLVALVALASIVVPVAVDLNETHLFNPDWSGHAKLHDAMSFIMSMGLGVGALVLLAGPVRRDGSHLWLAVFLAVWSWGALLLGGLIPGATYGNDAMGPPPEMAGIPLYPNAIIAIVLIVLGLVGGTLIDKGRRSA